MSKSKFNSEPTKRDEILLHQTLKQNKPIHFTSKFVYLTLWGDEINNQIQFKELTDRIAGPTSNLKYAHISPIETDEINPRPHQHAIIVLNRPKSFRARPILNHADGTKQTFWYSCVNSYTSRTGDISAIIKYITKRGAGMFKGDLSNKDDLKQTWVNALNDMDSYKDFGELEKNLMEINAEKYIQQEGKIKARWLRKNSRRIDIENYTRDDLLPWKEDLEEVKTIRKWLKCASGNKYRMGNLFIVGPTKTGKTEFAIQEIFMKYNTFLLRGDSLFDSYDDDQQYKFILFDDINYDKNLLRLIKAITSTINKKTMVNVKYSKAIVTARPCIHLLNQKEYDSVINLMSSNGGYSWWRRNSLTIFINEKLYKDPTETQNSEEQMQEQEKDYDPQKDLEEKYKNLDELSSEDGLSEENQPIEKVSFYNRLSNLMEELGYDEEFMESLNEKLNELKKKNKKIKKMLAESQEDNSSMMEEWNDELEGYQLDNPLGLSKEEYKQFKNDTMSKFERDRKAYFDEGANEEENSEDDVDYDEYRDEEMNNPLEHAPFGGKNNDMDIIYD